MKLVVINARGKVISSVKQMPDDDEDPINLSLRTVREVDLRTCDSGASTHGARACGDRAGALVEVEHASFVAWLLFSEELWVTRGSTRNRSASRERRQQW